MEDVRLTITQDALKAIARKAMALSASWVMVRRTSSISNRR